MASQLNGYAIVPHSTYDEFRQYLLTHGVNVDYTYGNQCWDSCALLWYQYGLRLQTGNGYAWGCWTFEADANAQPPFTKITTLSQVKRGDVIVFNYNASYYAGHIAFADEDYRPGSSRISCVGQNQGQGVASGTPSIVASMNALEFLGAFRNTNWTSPIPPTPPTPQRESKFPWVLYARKLRQKR